ncbi:MAG: hemolysin III family protein [Planctomycetota bacterium]
MTGVERPVDEIANLVTHGIGFLLSLAAAGYLMQSVAGHSPSLIAACATYVASLILVYGSSTLSHLFYDLQWRKRFRALDQASIFLLIAGTCTPLGVMYLNHGGWQWLLVSMWVLAFIGIGRVVHVGDLSQTDKSLYGLMGFLPVVGLGEMSRQAPEDVIFRVIAGGACYTLGTLFLCWSARVRYSHAVWHLLVMSGSACHYWAILLMISDH